MEYFYRGGAESVCPGEETEVLRCTAQKMAERLLEIVWETNAAEWEAYYTKPSILIIDEAQYLMGLEATCREIAVLIEKRRKKDKKTVLVFT